MTVLTPLEKVVDNTELTTATTGSVKGFNSYDNKNNYEFGEYTVTRGANATATATNFANACATGTALNQALSIDDTTAASATGSEVKW